VDEREKQKSISLPLHRRYRVKLNYDDIKIVEPTFDIDRYDMLMLEIVYSTSISGRVDISF